MISRGVCEGALQNKVGVVQKKKKKFGKGVVPEKQILRGWDAVVVGEK
jgi:hypothetical protein